MSQILWAWLLSNSHIQCVDIIRIERCELLVLQRGSVVAHTEEGMLDFFRAMHHRFENTISTHHGSENMLAALLTEAFTCYEGNAERQAKELPEPDCHKGCAACCTIRVVASAPEILLVARYLRANEAALKANGIDIKQRLATADDVTRGHDEQQRVNLRRRCPFIHKGACVIYSVRPLACRSHLSYDKQACLEAAAGRLDEIPYSEPHMNLRSLIQNALQSALRDADYPWASYELNHALSIALEDDQADQAWLSRNDILESAMVKDISLEEMGGTFDRIHGRTLQ